MSASDSTGVVFTVGHGSAMALSLTAHQVATLSVTGELESTLHSFPLAVLSQSKPCQLAAYQRVAADVHDVALQKQHMVATILGRLLSLPRVAALVAAYPAALAAFGEAADFPREPRLWFITRDVFGLFCYIFGWVTVLLVNYVTQVKLLWPWFQGSAVGLLHGAAFQASCVFILWAYFCAATTDPGTVTRKTASKGDELPPLDDAERMWKKKRRYCHHCECIKPPRAHHCSTCKRCVDKMDHHCPWVNNCVGSGNQKFFLQFLVWTFVGSAHAAALATWRGVQCFYGQWACMRLPLSEIIFLSVSTVLAYFFAFFVVAMMCDQREAAITDVTGIESNPIKLDRGGGGEYHYWLEKPRSTLEGFSDVCGEGPSLRWLLPAPMAKRYKWSPLHDADAYDSRDPRAIHHFKWVMETLNSGRAPPPVAAPEGQPLVPLLKAQFQDIWERQADQLMGLPAAGRGAAAAAAAAQDAAAPGKAEQAEASEGAAGLASGGEGAAASAAGGEMRYRAAAASRKSGKS